MNWTVAPPTIAPPTIRWSEEGAWDENGDRDEEDAWEEVPTPWRAIDVAARLEFVDDVHQGLTERQLVGHNTFGDTFQGDPLQHAWEELLDGLFYIWVAKKERSNGGV